jgi:DNA-binding NtrC family response regulator
MNFAPLIQSEFEKAKPFFTARFEKYQEIREKFEKQFLEFAVNQCGGNLVRTAKYLDMCRNSLRKKCIRHGIKYGVDFRNYSTLLKSE